MKKAFLVAAVAALVCIGSVAQAALYFSQSDLESMTQFAPLTVGWTASHTGAGLTTDPSYDYPSGNNPPFQMRGLAGATGLLIGQPSGSLSPQMIANGWTAMVAYNLGATELQALNAAAQLGGETLNSYAFNDNNSEWVIGVWALTADPNAQGGIGGGNDNLLLASQLQSGATSGALSLDFTSLNVPPNPILAAGVFVALKAGSSQGGTDFYHASWGVPEPTSLLVWGALGIVSLAAGRRRNDR